MLDRSVEGLKFFGMSPEVERLKGKLEDFMAQYIYPNEQRYYREASELGPYQVYPIIEELKPKARKHARAANLTCLVMRRVW